MTTRREILKAGAGLTAILAAGKAPAYLVRSMLGVRNALMTGKRLPYDAEIEYLESTGVQWIDSGVQFDANVGFWIDGQYVEYAVQNFPVIIGSESADGDYYKEVYVAYTTKDTTVNADQSGWGRDAQTDVECAGERFTCHFNYLNDGEILLQCGIDSSQDVLSASNAPARIGLFAAMNENHEPKVFSKARIYGCRISSGSVLVRDFVPVRKGTIGYLYDRVSGQLFGNAGTGDFVLGPDK